MDLKKILMEFELFNENIDASDENLGIFNEDLDIFNENKKIRFEMDLSDDFW